MLGAVVDGCPPLLPLNESDIQPDLDRRAPGQSHLVTQRKESDTVRIVSGVFEGRTLGTPIGLLIPNEDQRSGDYAEVMTKFRPSHADYTYQAKYGTRDWRGGGRTSARETAARVAAGAIARKVLSSRWGVELVAFVSKVGRLVATADLERVSRADVDRDADPLSCAGGGRGDDRRGRGGAQRGQLAGRHRDVRGTRLSAGVGRAGLRSPGGGPGPRDAEPAGFQGVRDRIRVRRHRSHRARAQRPLLHGGRSCADAEQSQRRRPGWHHQRRGRCTSGWRSSRPRR